MKTYNKLYNKVYSIENLNLAFQKAKKGKSKKDYVILFESNLIEELNRLQKELKDKTYEPYKLKRFVIRDPKTRTIHASIFRDRIVHHAIINVLQPIYEPIFIYDCFASRKNKGTHKAVNRLESFINKVSTNGLLVRNSYSKNSIKGYCLKADIKKYFDSMNHKVLVNILEKKISDKDFIWLIRRVLDNFSIEESKGVPLGNYTSQFFANVYLNELDYFVKHELKIRYYIRYVDDFVVLHKSRLRLKYLKKRIQEFLESLDLELHPDKSEIYALRNGITFLGYRIFFKYRLLRKRNIRSFKRKFDNDLYEYKSGIITKEKLDNKINGWFGYSKHTNTYNFRQNILNQVKMLSLNSETKSI